MNIIKKAQESMTDQERLAFRIGVEMGSLSAYAVAGLGSIVGDDGKKMIVALSEEIMKSFMIARQKGLTSDTVASQNNERPA